MRTVPEIAARRSVDRYNLDGEAADQSDLVYEAGVYLAQAKDAKEKAKLKYEGLCAEFALNIKLEPSIFGYGNEKISDTLAKDLAKQQPEVIAAHNAFLMAYKWEIKIDGLCKAMQSRQSMLRMLNDLWQNNYYTTDSISNRPKPRRGRRELGDNLEQGDGDDDFEA